MSEDGHRKRVRLAPFFRTTMSAASTVLSLLRHASPALPRCRSFHGSSARLGALVGPSDPVSHMRPILYDDPPLPRRRETTHPYSLREFNGDARDDQDFDLLWRMQRQELDRFNHNFWVDVCPHYCLGSSSFSILQRRAIHASRLREQRSLPLCLRLRRQ